MITVHSPCQQESKSFRKCSSSNASICRSIYSSKFGFIVTGIWTSASVVTPYTRTSFPCMIMALVLLGASSYEKIVVSFITQPCLSRDGFHCASMQFPYRAMSDVDPVCIPIPRQGQYQITFIFSAYLPFPNSVTFST
jgi:hypothetical protein